MDSATVAPRPPMRGVRAGVNQFGRAVVDAARTHRLFLGIILVYTAACPLVGFATGTSQVVQISLMAAPLMMLSVLFVLATVIGHTVWMAAVVRPEGSLFGAIGRDFKARFLQAERMAGFIVVIALAPLFFTAFSSFKRMIPIVHPFSLDETFMDWDRWLHGGEHVWRLLQPVFGTPLATTTINVFYNLWFFALLLVFIWQALSTKRPQLRMQFLLAFLLCWIALGTALATALSSAGPVYYGRVTGLPDPYAPLMAYLYGVAEQYPVWALTVQETLWTTFQAGGTDFGSGISAMPSMHVATSVLFALVAWRTSRALGIVFGVFALIIQIGSVHLAWHYAIDGYLSAVLTIPIWLLAGRLARAVVPGKDGV